MLLKKFRKSKTGFIISIIYFSIALLIAVGLKYHYSRAGSDELGWILGPTAGMVEYISGIRFEKEDGTGFLNQEYRIIIAPSCAGVNFMIIAFCAAAFSGLPYLKSSGFMTFWLGGSVAWAYLLTIAVNAFRIIASIYTIRADIHYGWLTLERLHRIEGVFIYFLFLYLSYMALERMIRLCVPAGAWKKKSPVDFNLANIRISHTILMPLFWYFFISMGIPILNRAYKANVPQFIEHGLVMFSVCMVVMISVFLIQLYSRWIRDRI